MFVTTAVNWVDITSDQFYCQRSIELNTGRYFENLFTHTHVQSNMSKHIKHTHRRRAEATALFACLIDATLFQFTLELLG